MSTLRVKSIDADPRTERVVMRLGGGSWKFSVFIALVFGALLFQASWWLSAGVVAALLVYLRYGDAVEIRGPALRIRKGGKRPFALPEVVQYRVRYFMEEDEEEGVSEWWTFDLLEHAGNEQFTFDLVLGDGNEVCDFFEQIGLERSADSRTVRERAITLYGTQTKGWGRWRRS